MRKILLNTGGIITFLFSILHIMFWEIGNWQEELSKLTHENSGIVQALNIVSIYTLVFCTFITFYIAKKEKYDFIEKAFLLFVAGYYLVRIVIGYPFFGFSTEELIIWIVCLFVAACYVFAIPQKTAV